MRTVVVQSEQQESARPIPVVAGAGITRTYGSGDTAVHALQGVSVEVGERQAAVDVQLVAEYGVSLADLATGIRRNVIASIERMTGLEVTEVNIEIQDVHLESEERTEDTSSEPRVQ